ncbi:outer membrane beta-barrel protein [Mangrovibacterium lignilyticum]|uniref:outer membrane beta-barrel protein n=1 Tax=Mangrovibacterium lignilyticum TaxID=2668052 RepID=UPI0013D705E3|nr:outer membrane beta-barrel protein [Mangrovibacterium lignilyticum]
MKKSYLLLIVLLFVSALNTLSAQEPEKIATDSIATATDSIARPTIVDIYQPEGFNFWEERFKGNWAGIFFSFNGFDKADYSMYAEEDQGFMEPELWQSNCLSINLIQISMRLQRNRNFIGLVTGVGVDIQSYRLSTNYSLRKGPDRIEPIKLQHEQELKSKFASVYLTAPLLIEFQVPIGHYDNRIYFSTGVITSLRLDTHTKVKYSEGNQRKKIKETDDFYLRDFRFSGTVRMGYRWINLFATYDLQPLFKDNRGPELYPFSVGLAFVTF